MKYSLRDPRASIDDSMRDYAPTHKEFKFKNFVRSLLITTIYASSITIGFGALAYCANSAAHAEFRAQMDMDAAEEEAYYRANPPSLYDLGNLRYEMNCEEVTRMGVCSTDTECACFCRDEGCDGGPDEVFYSNSGK